MRPLQLTINGFITYKGRETIDFTKFTQGSLFVISGPTGAGKTTIFDAICFALYGRISSQERGEGEELRCQYLSPEDEKTYVELVFEAGYGRVTIRRYPRQKIKRPRGKIDAVSEEVELYYGDKVITSKREADEKIVEWTGLTWEQFTKIVLLPQGEFRRFLIAPSNEKEEILRKIFDTQRYQRFSEEVKRRYALIQKKFAEFEQKVNFSLSSLEEEMRGKLGEYWKDGFAPVQFYAPIEEILDREEKLLSFTAKELEEEGKVLGEKSERQSIRIHQAKEHNRDLETLVRKSKEYDRLLEREGEFQDLKERLERSQKAKILKIKEEELIRREGDLEKLNLAITQLKNSQITLEEKKKIVQYDYDHLEQREEEVQRLFQETEKRKQELQKLIRLEETYKERNILLRKKEGYEKALKEIRKTFDVTETSLKELSFPLQKMEEETQNLIMQEKIHSKQEQKLLSLREIYKQLKSILAEYRECRDAEKELPIVREQCERAEREWKKKAEELEKSLLQIYAASLKEGEACPLCGSIHHPDPVHADTSVTKEDSEHQRQILNERQKRLIEVQEKISRSKKSLADLADHLSEYTVRLMQEEKLQTEVSEEFICLMKELSGILKSGEMEETIQNLLQRSKDLGERFKYLSETTKGRIQEIKKELDHLRSQREEEEKRRKERDLLQHRLHDTEKDVLLYREKEISCTGEINRLQLELGLEGYEEDEKKKREVHLRELEEKRIIQKKKIQEIQTSYQQVAEQLNQISGRLHALLETKIEEERSYRDSVSGWEKERANYFDTQEEYRNNLMKEEDMNRAVQEMETYESEKTSLKAEIEALGKRLEHRKEVDISSLEAEKERFEHRTIEIENLKEDVFVKLNQIAQVLSVLREVRKEQGKELELKENLSILHRLCSGENVSRATLETYVLMYYFEEVLAYANQRLYQMTDGQYSLHRKEDNFKGNRRNKGLELEILDANVGKRRNTTTLSGGEGFLASLSLALGLSDAIMNQAGQVEVHTLFIDEGFGTLDREKLQNAIDCLLDLTERQRLIGIISHVEELKQDIPNKILVDYHKDRGSSLKMVY